MVVIQHRSKRKPTGGKYKRSRIKHLHSKGSVPTHTKIDENVIADVRTKGGRLKSKLLQADTINVWDPKSKKHYQEKIKTSSANPANRHFARRNILTKGSVVETAKGKARITSRPGQTTVINGVIVE